MRNSIRLVFVSIAAFIVVLAVGAWGGWGIAPRSVQSTSSRAAQHRSHMPVLFEENRGQINSEALFLTRLSDSTVQFGLAGVVVEDPSGSAHARMTLAGANSTPTVRGESPVDSYTDYYKGNDPERWLTGIQHYASVVYENVYPGIDWVWYGNEGQLEYDLRVSAGADPSVAQLQFDERDEVRLDSTGDLIIVDGGRETRYLKPVVYQEEYGSRETVVGEYVLLAENRVGFELGSYDRTRELVIDPVLSYSAYFGAVLVEVNPSVVVDDEGSTYVITDLGNDVVIFKIRPDGSGTEYVKVLGGSSADSASCRGSAIAIDEAGNAYVTGDTQSSNFPTTSGAYSQTLSGERDLFVTRFNAAGDISYSTYLGGAAADGDSCLALGPDGDVYVAAETRSTDFPTTPGAYDRTLQALADITVSRLRLNGQGASDLIYSTYVGGDCTDQDASLVVDDAGLVYVVGQTGLPPTFPITANAFDTTHNGEIDIVFFVLNPAGQGNQDLVYSTFFGGSGTDERFGHGKGIALDGAGNVYIAGDTDSENVPIPTTPGAFDRTFNDEWDMFIAKFGPRPQGGFDLVFSTYLGGSGIDDQAGIVVDDAGLIYFSGRSDSEDVPFPVMNAIQPNYGGGSWDTVFGVMLSDGSDLLVSSYLGGSRADEGPDLFLGNDGQLTIVGETTSINFPVVNPPTQAGMLRGSYAGAGDLFISRIGDLGVRTFTTSNASTRRPDLAAETIASGYGTGLAGQTLVATKLPLPTDLGGTSVRLIDSNGTVHMAKLFFVSEFQINYLIPAGASLGWARVEIIRNGQVVSRDGVNITNVSPGIYTANGTGSGAPAATFLLVKADNSRISGTAFTNAPQGQRMAAPLDMGEEGDGLYLTFYSTGTSRAGTISATIDGVEVPAVGPFVLKPDFEGLEQDNIGPLPRSLVGRGLVKVKFFFDGVPANEVDINLQ